MKIVVDTAETFSYVVSIKTTGDNAMAKITLATLKSFVRKNEGKLFIECCSSFDGMTDCVETNHDAEFKPAQKMYYKDGRPFVALEGQFDNTLGYDGIWLVGGSRDYIKPYSENGFTGFNVYNCCGEFNIVVKD